MNSDRFRMPAVRVALVAMLALGAVACAGGTTTTEVTTPDTTEVTTAAGGGTTDVAAACDAIVDFNSAVFAVDTAGATGEELAATGEQLSAIWAPIAENPPADLSDEVGQISAALEDLAAGDPTAFDSEDTSATYFGVMGAIVDGCDFEALSATAVDYAFEGIPATVPAGVLALELTNEGSEVHEMIIFQKPDGDTRSAGELLNDPAMEGSAPSGFALAVPGETAVGLAELAAGNYFAVCFIPVGTTSFAGPPAEGEESGPPHFTQGMVTEFTVG